MSLIVGATKNLPIGISNQGVYLYKLKNADCDLNTTAFTLLTDFNCRWQLLYASLSFSAPTTVTATVSKTSLIGSAYTKSSTRDFSQFTDKDGNPNLTLYEFIGDSQDSFQKGEEFELSIPQTTGQPHVYCLIQGVQTP